MRTTTLLLSAATLFGAWPLVARFGAVPGAVASVLLAVAVALAASGGPTALAAAQGALGAFVAGLVSPGPTALGGALLLAGAYAERTSRVRGKVARAAHMGIAVVGGAIGGALVASFADGSLAVRAVAVTVAAVLAALPRLIEADDLVAHALESVATDVDEPAKGALLAGAGLRRNADEALLDRATARTVRRTWQALVRLAEARLRVQRSRVARSTATGRLDATPSPADAVLTMLDDRITSHVAALARAYAAVDTVRAAELGLDDAALRTAESAGEALDHVSRAMVDVQP